MAQYRFSIGYGMQTDAGVQRRSAPNQDSVRAFQGVSKTNQQFSLFVVADGMGGHVNGKQASELAVSTLADFLYPILSSRGVTGEEFGKTLVQAGVQRANDAVCQRNQEALEDSGTTITCVLIVDTIAYIANVGDSRTYLWRWSEHLRQITADHSVVARLVAANVLQPDDVYTHPKRNQIYRCLGEKVNVEVDVFVEELEMGDRVLLCSDGLWEMVRDPEIDEILLAAPTPETASEQLVDAANRNGGEDNVSAIVAQVYPPENQVEDVRVKAADELPSPELMPLQQLAQIGRYVVMPLAACVRAWCVVCGFLLLAVLPWLGSLPSKMRDIWQGGAEGDAAVPVHFHLVMGPNNNVEIAYHDLPKMPEEMVMPQDEPIVGHGWEWALH